MYRDKSEGNISPYLISFLRKNTKDTHLTYADGTWWFALAVTAEISMPLGGVIERKIGPRLTTLIGAWIMSLGVVLTGVAIEISFALSVLTYGVVFGFGTAVAYTPPMACAMKWMPERKGLINGCVLAGFGSGAFIFDLIQTAYINPSSMKPDQANEDDPTEKYYTQKELLNRVPNCFFILGGIYAGMQLVGCLLLTYPSDEDDDRTEYFESSTEDEERHTNRYSSVSSSYNRAELASVYASGNDSDLRPFEMLKTKCFYYLWLILFLNSQIFIFIPTLYKAYGLSFITDDKFLATVGAVASISNAAGRIFWGFLMDKTSFKTTMLILNTTLVVLMMTLVITQHGGKPMFLIWIVLIFGTFSGNFSVFPTATTMMFGSKYILINYGILFTATVVTAPVGALLSMTLRTVLGWFGMFCLMSGFAGAGLVLAYLFDDSGQQ